MRACCGLARPSKICLISSATMKSDLSAGADLVVPIGDEDTRGAHGDEALDQLLTLLVDLELLEHYSWAMPSTSRVLQCLCGARVLCDEEAAKLTHEGPECESFKEILARNKSGQPYVEAPQEVSSNTEEREVDVMVARTPRAEHHATAREFGIETSDARAAARGVLREMRARGWRINWPS